MAAIFTLLKPVDNVLFEKLFFWMPTLDSGLDGSYSKNALIVTYSIFIIFGVIVGPSVEELYFRGYLLPRIPVKQSELFHSILFAAYHIWTPWMFVTRILGMLPLIFAVKKKNIYIGIIGHILLNSLDVIVGFAFIFSLA
jgi:membrane protease YdiL (CAAX protease family)